MMIKEVIIKKKKLLTQLHKGSSPSKQAPYKRTKTNQTKWNDTFGTTGVPEIHVNRSLQTKVFLRTS